MSVCLGVCVHMHTWVPVGQESATKSEGETLEYIPMLVLICMKSQGSLEHSNYWQGKGTSFYLNSCQNESAKIKNKAQREESTKWFTVY